MKAQEEKDTPCLSRSSIIWNKVNTAESARFNFSVTSVTAIQISIRTDNVIKEKESAVSDIFFIDKILYDKTDCKNVPVEAHSHTINHI